MYNWIVNNPKYAEYIKSRGEVTPFFSNVYKAMEQGGELEGLSDEDAIEKVTEKAEQLKRTQCV